MTYRSIFKTRSFFLAAALCAISPAQAETGAYGGIGVGYSSNADYDCLGCGPVTALDDDGAAYKAFAGYRMHKNFAASVGYANLADTDASGAGFTDKLEVDGFYVAAHGIVPITDNMDLFATLGMFRWDQKVTFNVMSGSFDGTDVMYGAGFTYDVGKPSRVKVQAEWTRFADVGTHDPMLGHLDDYDLFTVNLVYQLP